MSVPSNDVLAITSLLKRERYYRDTAQWDQFRACYHPDTKETYINASWFEGDVDDFCRKSVHRHEDKVNIIHAFEPANIQICDDRAVSDGFCLMTALMTLDGHDYELRSYLRLFFRLRRLADTGEWRIVRMEAVYVRDSLTAAFSGVPETPRLEMTDAALAYPKAYRKLALIMLNRGINIRKDLPHGGDLASVDRILNGTRTYLNA